MEINSIKLKVYLYCGKGVGYQSLVETSLWLEKWAPIEWIDAKEVMEGAWVKDASLFVMPGGADLPYCRALNGAGNRMISTFVEQGGGYLGICAGSYYAGRTVEFGQGTDLQVMGERELAFFPGIVQGPTFSPFSYDNRLGAREVALSLSFAKEEAICFYHGGGHFCEAETKPYTEVLARYIETGTAAVVICKVGRGQAILSGVHLETDIQNRGNQLLRETILSRL